MARGADELLATLHEAGVETLVDVRRFPGSRRNPQFSQGALAAELQRSRNRFERMWRWQSSP